MPPTSSEIPATAANSTVIISVVLVNIVLQLLLATDGKIIIVTFLQLMVAAEYFRNLVDGLVGVFLLRGRTGNALQMGDGQDLFSE